MPGVKKQHGPHKYNKVNQQKKYHLLTLFYKHQVSLRQAAVIVGINYLTAKTIVFFHKNKHKSYQFDLQTPTISSRQAKNRQTALYTTLKKKNPVEERLHIQKTRIEVICSIGNVLNPPKHQIPSSNPPLQLMCFSNKDEQVIMNSQKYSSEVPKSTENSHSPIFAAGEEPHFSAYALQKRISTGIKEAPTNLVKRIDMAQPQFPLREMENEK